MSDNTSQLTHVELTLLGIGGAFDADLGVPNTGALLTAFSGETVLTRILIDCGHTCGRQLRRLGLTYEHIDDILVTHSHGDHIDGLEVVGYKSKFLFQRAVGIHTRQDVLDEIWASLEPKMGQLQVAKRQSMPAEMSTYFRPEPVDKEVSFLDGALKVTFLPVVHVWGSPAYALLIDLGSGPVIRWSGDTTFDGESPLFADLDNERGDTIFHDCIFFPYYDSTVHTHIEDLEKLPESTRERTILVHHGKITESAEKVAGMAIGQALDTFRFEVS